MDVRFYETTAGASPVLDYMRAVKAVSREQSKIIGRMIDLVRHGDTKSFGVSTRPLREGTRELRPGYHRIAYFVDGGICWLLHAWRKDRDLATNHDMDIAVRRMKEILERKKAEKK